MQPVTLGLIVGNRGFFPSHLCKTGRATMLAKLAKSGFKVVALSPAETEHGSIESLDDAGKCARLFARNRERIDGVLVTLPNFGDERAVANALHGAGLKVPVLIHAFPDAAGRMTLADRRDSFCGKISVCNNLRQLGIPFSLTTRHTAGLEDPSFEADLARFAGICRVVRGVKGLRIGALGARPAAFNTVRYSEKLLQQAGVTVETLDLFELMGRVGRMGDREKQVQAKLQEIRRYVKTDKVPAAALLKMAKLGAAIDGWMEACDLDATAVQCWTAIEEFFGVVPCCCMSLLSNRLMPSGCEVDVMGAVSMCLLVEAGGRPSALVDWNNNYGDDPDKGVLFHCSTLPKDLFGGIRMDYQAIIAGSVGEKNAYGTIVGRLKAQPFTFLRCTTDDAKGTIKAFVGEGEFTDDKLETFGGYGVFRVPELQRLLRHICEEGYEHHVAVNPVRAAGAVAEALGTYLGWPVYRHA